MISKFTIICLLLSLASSSTGCETYVKWKGRAPRKVYFKSYGCISCTGAHTLAVSKSITHTTTVTSSLGLSKSFVATSLTKSKSISYTKEYTHHCSKDTLGNKPGYALCMRITHYRWKQSGKAIVQKEVSTGRGLRKKCEKKEKKITLTGYKSDSLPYCELRKKRLSGC